MRKVLLTSCNLGIRVLNEVNMQRCEIKKTNVRKQRTQALPEYPPFSSTPNPSESNSKHAHSIGSTLVASNMFADRL